VNEFPPAAAPHRHSAEHAVPKMESTTGRKSVIPIGIARWHSVEGLGKQQ